MVLLRLEPAQVRLGLSASGNERGDSDIVPLEGDGCWGRRLLSDIKGCGVSGNGQELQQGESGAGGQAEEVHVEVGIGKSYSTNTIFDGGGCRRWEDTGR